MSVFTNALNDAKAEAGAYTAAVLGLLGTRAPIVVLKRTEAALRRAIKGMSSRALGRPERPEKWSVRHVIQHLADSELVWGWRIRLILAHDRPPITGYDQDAFAERLGYAHSRVNDAIEEFAVLRRSNLRLIGRASPDDLKRAGVHSERGDESIEHLMKLYAGHDILHLNQIARIKKAIG